MRGLLDISLLVPTRNRPDYIEKLVNSAFSLAKEPEGVEFVFYVDSDDTLSIPKIKELQDKLKLEIVYIQGPRIVLSEMWNKCYDYSIGSVLWHGGDDNIFKTQDWDQLVINAFDKYSDKIVLVGGNDMSNHHDGKFFTHGFIHQNWVKTIGYFVPPKYSSDYNDTHLNEVARKINRWHYVPELNIEHMHPAWNKGPMDSTHLERAERHRRDKVAELYDREAPQRELDAQKLQDFINKFPRLETLKELAKQAQELDMGY